MVCDTPLQSKLTKGRLTRWTRAGKPFGDSEIIFLYVHDIIIVIWRLQHALKQYMPIMVADDAGSFASGTDIQ